MSEKPPDPAWQGVDEIDLSKPDPDQLPGVLRDLNAQIRKTTLIETDPSVRTYVAQSLIPTKVYSLPELYRARREVIARWTASGEGWRIAALDVAGRDAVRPA